ncbi:CAP Gly-rich domain-containing protein [Dimargaris cristalligena]|uniref:CAP Gly-rich domain-containing protein n=1 Tax=Dimargaris cristalligena TaxID=215637 RepID=A0A4P9ZSG7_9FUNG|nr:CAP Gly-rich domain-containing protein [Dimargaris cristalligena]|eukprot:RKP36423.1 CAP Gly-rich domain-containing protein [Dimargaris cristalligena]
MSIVTLWVASADTQSERRFDKALSLETLKTKLEPITGIPAAAQSLELYQGEICLAQLNGPPDTMLGAYPVADFCILKVTSTDRSVRTNQYTDVSLVEKYEMEDGAYDGLRDTVRAFKKAHKLGRFSAETQAQAKAAESEFKQEAGLISTGARCQVRLTDDGLAKNGTVRYVGPTHFSSGYWVGVEYDEPLGKNDGSIDGERYFSCLNKHGAFVRPNRVILGDFDDDIDWDNLDEM